MMHQNFKPPFLLIISPVCGREKRLFQMPVSLKTHQVTLNKFVFLQVILI